MNGADFLSVYMLAVILGIVLTAGGQVLFKRYYQRHRRLDLLAALAMFGLVPLINFVALRGMSFGFVYMSTAATQILVLLMCRVFLGEKLGRDALPGIALILAGIIVYTL
jgi:drug/metabolite transporter (DMT)-like permease